MTKLSRLEWAPWSASVYFPRKSGVKKEIVARTHTWQSSNQAIKRWSQGPIPGNEGNGCAEDHAKALTHQSTHHIFINLPIHLIITHPSVYSSRIHQSTHHPRLHYQNEGKDQRPEQPLAVTSDRPQDVQHRAVVYGDVCHCTERERERERAKIQSRFRADSDAG